MHIASVCMSPSFTEVLFKQNNEIEIHAPNQIMLDFYPVLPHLTIKVVGDDWEVGGG